MTVTTSKVHPVGKMRDDVDALLLCPRCERNTLPVGYPGALSRADNATEVCSECGSVEALADFFGRGVNRPEAEGLMHLDPATDWPVKVPFDPRYEAGIRIGKKVGPGDDA